jgi:hypothetical protein
MKWKSPTATKLGSIGAVYVTATDVMLPPQREEEETIDKYCFYFSGGDRLRRWGHLAAREDDGRDNNSDDYGTGNDDGNNHSETDHQK